MSCYYALAEMASIPFHLPQVSYRTRCDARLDDPCVYLRDTICDARVSVLDTRTVQSVPIPRSQLPFLPVF